MICGWCILDNMWDDMFVKLMNNLRKWNIWNRSLGPLLQYSKKKCGVIAVIAHVMYHEAGASTAPKLVSLTLLHGGAPTCHESENLVKSFQSIKDEIANICPNACRNTLRNPFTEVLSPMKLALVPTIGVAVWPKALQLIQRETFRVPVAVHQKNLRTGETWPLPSMYGIFTYTYHTYKSTKCR